MADLSELDAALSDLERPSGGINPGGRKVLIAGPDGELVETIIPPGEGIKTPKMRVLQRRQGALIVPAEERAIAEQEAGLRTQNLAEIDRELRRKDVQGNAKTKAILTEERDRVAAGETAGATPTPAGLSDFDRELEALGAPREEAIKTDFDKEVEALTPEPTTPAPPAPTLKERAKGALQATRAFITDTIEDVAGPASEKLTGAPSVKGKLREDLKVAIKSAPTAIYGAYASAVEGPELEDIFLTKDWKDIAIEEARKHSEQSLKMADPKENYVDWLGIKLNRHDVRTAPHNLGFSLVSMGSSVLAGLAGLFAGGGPATGFALAGAAGGATAYRMGVNSFMREFRQAIDFAAEKQVGRKLTDEEFIRIAKDPDMQVAARGLGMWIKGKGDLQELAKEHGLHEAGWEALGNTSMLFFGNFIFKNALKGGIVKAAIGTLGATAVEVATEVPTQLGQQRVESKAGMTDEPMRSFTEAKDWWKSYEEVAGPTILTTMLMGAGTTGAGLATKGVADIADMAGFRGRRQPQAVPGAPEQPPAPRAAPSGPAPTHRLEDGTPVTPKMDKGKPVPGIWLDEAGQPVEAARAEPIQPAEPNATWTVGNVPYDVAVVGKGTKPQTALLQDGQQVPIAQLDLADEAKVLLGLAKPEEAAKPDVKIEGAVKPTEPPAAPPPPPAATPIRKDEAAPKPVEAKPRMVDLVTPVGEAEAQIEVERAISEEEREKAREWWDNYLHPPRKITDKEMARRGRLVRRARERQMVNSNVDSLVDAAIKLGGFSNDYRMDVTGDDKTNPRIPFVGYLFREGGTSPDEMVRKLQEYDYFTQAEIDDARDTGGTRLLVDKIKDELAGIRKHFSVSRSEQIYAEEREQLERERAEEMEAEEKARELSGVAPEISLNVTPEMLEAQELPNNPNIIAAADLMAMLPDDVVERLSIRHQDATDEEWVAVLRKAVEDTVYGKGIEGEESQYPEARQPRARYQIPGAKDQGARPAKREAAERAQAPVRPGKRPEIDKSEAAVAERTAKMETWKERLQAKEAAREKDRLQGQSPETAIRSVEDAVKILVAGGLKPLPERDGQCYRFAGKSALAKRLDFVIGVVEKGVIDGQLIWHAVNQDAEGRIYEPVTDKWFAPGVYERLQGFIPVHRMTWEETAKFGAREGMWPSPPLLDLKGGDLTYPKPDQIEPLKAEQRKAEYRVYRGDYKGEYAEIPPHVAAWIKEQGVDPTEVEIITTGWQWRDAMRAYGLPNAMPLTETGVPFGKTHAVFINDDTGKPVAFAHADWRKHAAQLRAMDLSILEEASDEEQARWQDVKWREQMDYWAAAINGRRVTIWKPNEGPKPGRTWYQVVVGGAVSQLPNAGRTKTLQEAKQFAFEHHALLPPMLDAAMTEEEAKHRARFVRRFEQLLDGKTPAFRTGYAFERQEFDDLLTEQGLDIEEVKDMTRPERAAALKPILEQFGVGDRGRVIEQPKGEYKRPKPRKPVPPEIQKMMDTANAELKAEGLPWRFAQTDFANGIEFGTNAEPVWGWDQYKHIDQAWFDEHMAEMRANPTADMEEDHAQEIRGDEGQVRGRRGEGQPEIQRGAVEGREDLQRPEEAGAEAGDRTRGRGRGEVAKSKIAGEFARLDEGLEFPETVEEFKPPTEAEIVAANKILAGSKFFRIKPMASFVAFAPRKFVDEGVWAQRYENGKADRWDGIGHRITVFQRYGKLWADESFYTGETAWEVELLDQPPAPATTAGPLFEGAARASLELTPQTPEELAAKEKQAKRGKIEEVTVMVGDELKLTPPPGRATTVSVMRQAVDMVGEQAFRTAVEKHLADLGEDDLTEAEKAAEIEGVARRIVEGRRAPEQLGLFSNVDQAAAQTDKKPTVAEQKAGNYEKGRFRLNNGQTVAIETQAGRKRRPEWPALTDHYGYIVGTVASDSTRTEKQGVDIFVKPGTTSDFAGNVYVVNQFKADGTFDEHKAMYGYASLPEAQAAYQSNYEAGWDRGRSITPINQAGFRVWSEDRGTNGPQGGKLTLARAKSYEQEARNLPAAKGADTYEGAAAPQRDLFAASPIPGSTAVIPERVIVELEEVRRFELPEGKIENARDAAQAFMQLIRSPRERFQVIALDAEQKPIAAYDLFAGTATQTSVYPREIAAVAGLTPGVKSVWFAHHHPSGVPQPSQADQLLQRSLYETFRGSNITLSGHVIIAGNTAFEMTADGIPLASFEIPPVEKGYVTVPVYERVITFEQAGTPASLTSPGAVRDFIRNFAPKEAGLIVLDAQHRVIAWWPLDVLKTQEFSRELFRLVGRNNPSAAIIWMPGVEPATVEVASHYLKERLSYLDVKVLDAFTVDAGGAVVSFAERGLLDSAKGAYLQLRPKFEGGSTVEAVRAELSTDPLARSMGDNLVVVTSPHELPESAIVMALGTEGGLENVQGAYAEGKVWLVAGHIKPGGAKATLFHESVGHHGLFQVLTAELRTDLNSALQEIYNARTPSINAAARNGALKLYRFNLSDPAHQRAAAAEWMAHRAEAGEEQGLWQRFVAQVRSILRRYGFVNAWTDNDILGLLVKSRQFLMRRARALNSVHDAALMKAKPGVEFGRLTKLLGSKIYGEPKHIATVSVKELLQNSFDSIKPLLDNKTLDKGEISILIEPDKRTITVVDNGHGMAPEILATKFLQIAGTQKETDRASGSLGVAKGLFLYDNKRLRVETVRDGVRSTLDTTGPELMAAAEGSVEGPEIKTEPVGQSSLMEKALQKLGATGLVEVEGKIQRGTKVTVWIPESYVEASTGDKRDIEIPRWDFQHTVLTKSPLFSNIDVTLNGEQLDNIGSTFKKDDYSAFAKANFRWGDATIYLGKKKLTGYHWEDNVHFLSNGLWQFSMNLKEHPLSDKRVEREIYVDIHPRVKAEDPGYPIDLNRQRLAPATEKDFGILLGYIAMAQTRDRLKNQAQNFGAIRYMTKVGFSKPTLLQPKINTAELEKGLSIVEGDTVEIEEGRLIVNGRVVPTLSREQMEKAVVDVDTFKIDQATVKSDSTMVHDNLEQAGVPFTDLMQQRFPDFVELMGAIGESMRALRNFIVTGNFHEAYNQLSAYGLGISFERLAGHPSTIREGVHISVPFNALFVNPAAMKGASMEEIGNELFGTVLHEFVHARMRGHDADYVNELQRMYSRILTSPFADAIRRNLVALVMRHEATMRGIQEAFYNENLSSVGNTLKGEGSERPAGAPEGARVWVPPGRGIGNGAEVRGRAREGDLGILSPGVSQQREGSVGPFLMLRNPTAPTTIYGMGLDGRLRGIATRNTGAGIWEVRTTRGDPITLLASRRRAATTATTVAEVERIFAAQGLTAAYSVPPNLPPNDAAVVESTGRAFDLEDADIGTAGIHVVHPRTKASFDPDFAPVVQVAEAQVEERDFLVSEMFNEAKPFFDLGAASKRKVSAVLELGRLNKTTYGRGADPVVAQNVNQPLARLSRQGETITLDDTEKAAYWAVRRSMDMALAFIQRQMIREHGLNPDTVATRDQILASITAGMPPYRKRELQRLAEQVETLRAMRRTGYVPFTRWGNYAIVVKDPSVVVDPTNPAPQPPVYYELVEWQPGVTSEIAQARARAAELRAQFPAYVVPEPMHVSRLKGQAPLDLGMLDQLARMAYVDRAQYEDMRAKLVETQQKMGFRAHLLTSNDVPGYSPNFERAIADYILGAASHLSRARYRQEWQDAIGGIPGWKRNLRKYAEDFRNYAESPREEWQRLRLTAYFYYLAGVPATAMINLSQPMLTTWPLLQTFTNTPNATWQLSRGYAEAALMIRTNNFQGLVNPNEFFDPSKAPADVRAALSLAWEKGIMAPMTTMEMMGLSRDRPQMLKGLDRRTRQTIEFVAHAFMTAERTNRITSFIAGYRIASQPGMRDKILRTLKDNALAQLALQEASDFAGAFAEWVVDETQFRTGKVNRATLQRGPGTAIFQFKDYAWQMIELYARTATLAGPRGKVAAALMLMMLWLWAGLWGMPFAETIRWGVEAALRKLLERDIDLKVELRRQVGELSDSPKVAEMVAHGIFRGIEDSPELSSRIGLGSILPDPDRPLTFLGVPADLLWDRWDKAGTWTKRGEYGLAAAQVAPNFIKNIIEAAEWEERGVRSQKTGGKLVSEKELTKTDIWMKRTGFRPRSVAEATEMENAKNRLEHSVDEMRRSYYHKIATNLYYAQEARKQGNFEAEAEARQKAVDAIKKATDYDNTVDYEWQKLGLTLDAVANRMAAERFGPAFRDIRARKTTREGRKNLEELYNR